MESIGAVVFDLDPLLLQARSPVSPSIRDAVSTLRRGNVPFCFATNNSLLDQGELVAHLAERGLELDEHDISLPATYLARLLSHNTPRATIYLLGASATRRELEKTGLRVIDEPMEIGHLCDYVVAGADPNFRYASMVEALRCFEMGAGFVTVDEEPVYYGKAEPIPGGGPVAAALRVILGKEPSFTGAMPNAERLIHIAESFETPPQNCLLVSDHRRDPSAVAHEAGMPLLLIGEGLKMEERLIEEETPAYATDIADFPSILEERFDIMR